MTSTTIDQEGRIASLETKVDSLIESIKQINVKLEVLLDDRKREEAARDTVYKIGKWTIWVFAFIASVVHWDTVAAWLKNSPLK